MIHHCSQSALSTRGLLLNDDARSALKKWYRRTNVLVYDDQLSRFAYDFRWHTCGCCKNKRAGLGRAASSTTTTVTFRIGAAFKNIVRPKTARITYDLQFRAFEISGSRFDTYINKSKPISFRKPFLSSKVSLSTGLESKPVPCISCPVMKAKRNIALHHAQQDRIPQRAKIILIERRKTNEKRMKPMKTECVPCGLGRRIYHGLVFEIELRLDHIPTLTTFF